MTCTIAFSLVCAAGAMTVYVYIFRSEVEEMTDWQPIETKPPFTHVEERGEYRTDDGSLWYFKPTHWRPIQPNQKS